MNADQIRAIFREELQSALSALFVSGPTAAPSPLLTVGQQAIQLAKQGKIEESKALLRAHGKRRAA